MQPNPITHQGTPRSLKDEILPAEQSREHEHTHTNASRLSCLDAWRGLTVLLMLLVNNVTLDALAPPQLQHAAWGAGITVTDLVFPWFLFCAGAALPFAMSAAQKAGFVGWSLIRKLVVRTVLLYLVGALETSVTQHQVTLGLGVLQLIALASFFGSLISLLNVRWRLVISAALLIGYDLFITQYPVHGVRGLFTEQNNAVKVINDTVLSSIGLRGLLSVIPATALVLLGAIVAQPLHDRRPRAPWILMSAGITMSALGWLWAQHLEFNKAVWTPSYVVYTSGLATLGMLLFYLLADSGRRWNAVGERLLTVFTIPGRNALFAYVAPILFKVLVLMNWHVSFEGESMSVQKVLLTIARSHYGIWGGGWLYTIGYMVAVWLALAALARRGWIWKL